MGGESTRPGSRDRQRRGEERGCVLPVIEGLRKRLRDDDAGLDRHVQGADGYPDGRGGRGARRERRAPRAAGPGDPRRRRRGRRADRARAPARAAIDHDGGRLVRGRRARGWGRVGRARRGGGCGRRAAARSGWTRASGSERVLEHNLALLRDLGGLARRAAVPLMVGVSRKRFLGDLTGKPPGERIFRNDGRRDGGRAGRRVGRVRPRRRRHARRRSGRGFLVRD